MVNFRKKSRRINAFNYPYRRNTYAEFGVHAQFKEETRRVK